MKLKFGYRGDSRDSQGLKNSGGFVPRYLLNSHANGFAGFLQCNNKTAGALGGNCPGFDETTLFANARAKLTEVLRNPGLLQQHVMFNNLGYLATATVAQDAYEEAHKYKIMAEIEFDLLVADARNELNVVGGTALNNITRNFRILMNATRLFNATLIATVPHQGVELTFLSPVPYRYISEF